MINIYIIIRFKLSLEKNSTSRTVLFSQPIDEVIYRLPFIFQKSSLPLLQIIENVKKRNAL